MHGLVQHPAHGLLGRAERFVRRGRAGVTPRCGSGQGVQHFGHCLGQGQGFQIDIAFERHGLLLGPMAPIAPTARINVFPASIAALRAKGKKDGLWRGRAAAIMKKRRNEKENLTLAELSYLQMLAQDLLEYTDSDLDTAIIEGKIQEVHHA